MIKYLLVALFATVVGATAGIGGGVMIKPVMDLFGDYDVVAISVLSSFTVLSMAIVATIKQMRNGFRITKNAIVIATGAVIGGIMGGIVFSYVKDTLNMNTVTIIQSAIIFLLMVFSLFSKRLPGLSIKSLVLQGALGLILGLLSSFLGIGGGPINVAAMCLLIGCQMRDSARISVFIILLSQIAGLITKGAQGMLGMVDDYSVLLVMIPAAIAGGFIGSSLNIKLSEKNIVRIFDATVILVMVICLYNIARYL